MSYLDDALGTQRTPQSEPIPGSTQVANAGGGFAWAVDDRARVSRFLILGSEGGTYYQRERELTRENIAAGLRLIETDGEWLVNELVSVSLAGRAAKVQPTLFLLAAACAAKDVATKKAALRAIVVVCRTGTHLFTFCRYVEQFRGHGRALNRAIADWYYQDAPKLALQAVKYRQREGWTHRDVLRLVKPKTGDERLEHVWQFMLGTAHTGALEPVIQGFTLAQTSNGPTRTAELIRQYGLPREAVLPEHLTSPLVWEALVEMGMPITALLRNLGNMGKAGLLEPMSIHAKHVAARLVRPDLLAQGRVHPIQILAALMTYRQGHGTLGKGTWPVNPLIVDALDAAFYASFGSVQPSGRPTMLALDTSSSMGSGSVVGIAGLTPQLASAAMCLVTAAVEPLYGIFGFASSALVPLEISAKQRLDDVLHTIARARYNGGTNCALPMMAATSAGLEVETFVIYTDNETNYGAMHPKQALDEYRAKGPGNAVDARVAVVAMTAGGFSIADPNDRGMLDLVGFDTATPEILRAFSTGEL